MRITLTAKVQVLADEAQREVLDATMDAYRDACNRVSKHIFETHDLRQPSLNKALYRGLREDFGLRSQMAQSVLKTVIARYKALLSKEGEWIKPEFKKPQYDLVWNRDYSLARDRFSVNSLSGRVKLPYCAKGMEKYFDREHYAFGTAKLVKKHGKYFLHIPVTFDADDVPESEICNVVGIDRGINFVAATYDSAHKSAFVSGKAIKQKRAQYKALRRDLQRRGTPSARRKLKSIGQRENRWMQDVNHRVSKALVERNPARTLFVIEDLEGIRKRTEQVYRKDRYVSVSWSFYDLEQKLMYKAALRGSAVLKVDPRYTSQTCPVCGHTEASNRNKRMHTFHCKSCGYTSNDDRIGAMNLYRMGINHLARGGEVPDTVAAQHA